MIIRDRNNYLKKSFKNNYVAKHVFTKRAFFIFFLLGIIISCYWASDKLKTLGYTGLYDFTETITSNYFKGLKANPQNISIEIKDKDFKFLKKKREKALERGLIINDIDVDYVPATLEYEGKKLKIKLRLKGHMTDHLQDNKWSFRIKVKDENLFMGMKRFSIQHPGTRGYIYEWIYHELMKREDIISLRYKFINVTLNGRDWGIYAVEENFENELLENNHRVKAPILRFNPDLYWVNRYNEIKGENSSDEYASYYSANPEAYREDKALEDSIQKKYYLKAIALIEGLRGRQISVDQAFDIPRLAKFHAIIDLVGGEHSIDWSDIKYYYNPVTSKLEPVAYESFTNLNSRDLSSLYKFVELDSNENYADWHTMIFSNKIFFAAYLKELEHITQSAYLDTFFNQSNEELNKNLAIIYKEFPYKKFDKEGYYNNQKMIQKILDPPKAIHAYFNKMKDNTVQLQIAGIDALPVQIKSINVATIEIKPSIEIILPAKQQSQFAKFKECMFLLPSNFVWNDSLVPNIKVNYNILGSSTIKEAKVFPFPHTDSEFISKELKNKQSNISEFNFLMVDESSKKIFIKKGKQIIDKDIVIPSGYQLIANSEVALDLKNHAGIISYSPIIFIGTDDQNILIGSSDSTGQGILIVGSTATSTFKNVTFRNLPKVKDTQWKRSGYLTFYESPVLFIHCSVYNSKAEDAVNIIRSSFSFKECLFHKMKDDAIDADFSQGTIDNCAFENCNENALDITMCNVKVSSIYVNGAGNKAFNIKAGSKLSGNDIRILNANIAVSAEDMSTANFNTISISDSKIGVVAYKNKPGAGHPEIKLERITFTHVKKNYLKEKKSSIQINEIEINDEVNDVESIIKSDKKKNK